MKYTIEDSTLIAVADKLREKTRTSGAIVPEEMPEKVEEVFAAGEKSEWDRFWDAYQANGTLTECNEMFAGLGWTNQTFHPKYSIHALSAYRMFAACACTGNLDELLRQNGISISFENCTNAGALFYTSDFSELESVDLSSIQRAPGDVFSGCYALHTIGNLKTPKNVTQSFSNWFTNCTALQNIRIDGVIESNFDIHWSTRLSHDSLMSIINALADYSDDNSGTEWIVTLGESNLQKLTEEEIGIVEEKGWVLA